MKPLDKGIHLFGNKLIDFNSLGELALRFCIDLIVITIIVRLLFLYTNKDRNFIFTNFIINIAVFFMCTLLSNIKFKIGFAFGLFAVFSILRYRTEQIPIKEMTYLFIVIIIAVINSLGAKKVSYFELIFVNLVMVLCIYFLEIKLTKNLASVKHVCYEKIHLIKPENHEDLVNDLKERTGLNIKKVDIEDINFLNDTVALKIYYKKNSHKG